MNVPNHTQIARISNDIRRIQRWQYNQTTPWSEIHTSWTGNSYGGYCLTQTVEGTNGAPTTAVVYHLFHWSTEIATIEFREDEIIRVTMNASYITPTTRQFQGRILRGLQAAGIDTDILVNEFSMPTQERKTVTYLTNRHGQTL